MHTSQTTSLARRLTTWALLPVAALTLSACGAEDEDASSPSTQTSVAAPSSPGTAEAPSTDAAPSTEAADPAVPSEEPGTDPQSPSPAAGEDAASGGESAEHVALTINSFADFEGISQKVDSLSATDTCGYLQGALANPASLDSPAAGLPGIQELSTVAPQALRAPLASLAGALATASGPEDPELTAQLAALDEACLAAVS